MYQVRLSSPQTHQPPKEPLYKQPLDSLSHQATATEDYLRGNSIYCTLSNVGWFSSYLASVPLANYSLFPGTFRLSVANKLKRRKHV